MMAVIIELDQAKGLLMTAYLLVDMLGGQTLCAQVVQHQINLKPNMKPVAQKLQHLGKIQQEALLAEVKKLSNAGFIYPVEDLEWVSPVVVTPKKNGKWRVCVDYKPLNAATKRDHFPLPFQDEILNEVAAMRGILCVMVTLAISKSA